CSLFFFSSRRRHTRFSRDWSSDVCSSDLVVTKPFQFEGNKRMRQADDGIEALQKVVDTLIIIPNQNLFRLANEKTTFTEAFALRSEERRVGTECNCRTTVCR